MRRAYLSSYESCFMRIVSTENFVLLRSQTKKINLIMTKLFAALFDLDGVVVDTEPQYTEFWTTVGKRDFPDIPTFANDIKGSTLVQVFEKYYPGDVPAQERVIRELDAFEASMDYPFVPGVLAFVDSLHMAGIKTAVVTSSNAAKMESLYRVHPDFKSHFDRIFTSEDTKRSKPFPDCYISAALKFGCSSQNSVVFEDSLNGLRAGMDSGAHVVGLTTSHPKERISDLCHETIPDFSNVTPEDFFDIKINR